MHVYDNGMVVWGKIVPESAEMKSRRQYELIVVCFFRRSGGRPEEYKAFRHEQRKAYIGTIGKGRLCRKAAAFFNGSADIRQKRI